MHRAASPAQLLSCCGLLEGHLRRCALPGEEGACVGTGILLPDETLRVSLANEVETGLGLLSIVSLHVSSYRVREEYPGE